MNHKKGKILDEVLLLLRSKSNYRFTVDQIAKSLSISTDKAFYLLTQLVQKNKVQLIGVTSAGSDSPKNVSFQINEEGFFFIKKGGFNRAQKRKWRVFSL